MPSNVAPVVMRTTTGATVSLGSPFLLTLRTTQACWVQITDASGAVVFTETLPPGQEQQIPGSGTIVMKLGNMTGVTISAGNVDLDLGGLPRTADITFQTA
jgi:cytoskeletal protein RodZ